MSFWSSLKDTAESLGNAAVSITPFGVAYDLATAAFDDKDDNFGTLVDKVAARAANVADPFINDDTWSGAAIGKTMETLDTVYREGISEPLSTAATMWGGLKYANRDSFWGTEGWGDLFDGDRWADAYRIAQNRSIGQSLVVADKADAGEAGVVADPFDERAYKQINKADPIFSSLQSGAVDFAARWYLDPGVVAGKGVAAVKAARRLKPADRINLAENLAKAEADRLGFKRFVPGTEEQATARAAGMKTRTDEFLDWSDGLDAARIYHGSTELKVSPKGQTIAGFLADANKIEDKVLRRDAKRRILAVAAGDTTQIKRLEDEIGEAAPITDALKNMHRGTTVEMKTLAVIPGAKSNPAFIADLERQLGNQNTAGEITKYITSQQERLKALLDTERSLSALPTVTVGGKRAVGRVEGKGLGRDATANTGLEDSTSLLGRTIDKTAKVGTAPYRLANNAAKRLSENPAQHLIQRGLYHVPLLVLRGADAPLRLPTKAADALRTQHLQGTVNLHDWNGATGQLDSMMKMAGVDHGTRLQTLSKALLLRSGGDEMSKMKVIDEVEKTSVKALWAKYGAKTSVGEDADVTAFLDEVMSQGSRGRAQSLGQIRGRAYAATEMSDEMLAGRTKGFEAMQDMARQADTYGEKSWAPRVDHFDDHGTPVSVPLLETQLRNSVPLFDIDLAKKAIKRDASFMSRLARTWKTEAAEAERLTTLKGLTGASLEKALGARRWAMDWAVHLAQKSMRAWKFSVLFRLGYRSAS